MIYEDLAHLRSSTSIPAYTRDEMSALAQGCAIGSFIFIRQDADRGLNKAQAPCSAVEQIESGTDIWIRNPSEILPSKITVLDLCPSYSFCY